MKELIFIIVGLFSSFWLKAQLINNGTLMIKNGTQVSINGSFSNNLTANFNNEGIVKVKENVINHQNMSNGKGTLILDGAKNQSITGDKSLLVNDIIFNNVFGINIEKELRVDGKVHFQNGIITAKYSNAPLTLTANGVIDNIDTASNKSHVNGFVKKEGIGAFVYPVGDSIRYQKIKTNLSENSNGLMVQYQSKDAGSSNFGQTGSEALALNAYNNNEFWKISAENTAIGNVTIYLDDYKTPNLSNINAVKVARKDNNEWLNEGNIAIGNINNGFVVSNTLNKWGDFTIGTTCMTQTIFAMKGGGAYCEGNIQTFPISLEGSMLGVSYQLQLNGQNIGNPMAGNGTAIQFGDFSTAGNYSVISTTSDGCTKTMNGIATILIQPKPTQFSLSGGGTYCAGTDGAVININQSETGVFYQLQLNGQNVGTAKAGTGGAIDLGKQTNAGIYTVLATNATTGCQSASINEISISIDDLLPTFVAASIPANITINCTDAVPMAIAPTTTSQCSSVSMIETSNKGTSPNECNFYSYTITRTWTATDKRGNTALAHQMITVVNQNTANFGAINDITVTEWQIPTQVSFNLNQCNTPASLSFTDIKTDLIPMPCQTYHYTLNRTWKVTDVCGNTNTRKQLITARGIRLTCPSNKEFTTNSDGKNDANCSTVVSASQSVAPIFLDNCQTSSLSYSISGATNLNGSGSVAGITFNKGVSYVNYTLKTGNALEKCTFSINVSDMEAPKLITIQQSVIDDCDFPNPISASLTPNIVDNCSGVSNLTIISDVTVDVTACNSKASTLKYTKLLTRTWKGTDASGNTATSVQRVYLRDMQSPTASPKSLEVFIGNTNITLSAAAFDLNSSDNCTSSNNLIFKACVGNNCTALNNAITLAKNLISAGQNQATVPVSFQVWDACYNKSTIAQTFVVLKRVNTIGNYSDPSSVPTATEFVNRPKVSSGINTSHGNLKCYPNPFSDDLNLEFNLVKEVKQLNLKIYDTHGRLIEKDERGEAEIGYYQMRWNLSHLAPAMYHICLEIDGNCMAMERVLLLK